jgi:hypothetical protein
VWGSVGVLRGELQTCCGLGPKVPRRRYRTAVHKSWAVHSKHERNTLKIILAATTDELRAHRVAHLARSRGYRLRKLYRQDDAYWLTETDTGLLVIGVDLGHGAKVGRSLDYVEAWLGAAGPVKPRGRR